MLTMRSTLFLVGVLLMSLLVGCGTGGDTAAGSSPDTIHQQWVAALRENQRDQALTLLADRGDLQQAQLDGDLDKIQREIASGNIAFYRGEHYGTFQDASALPTVAVGAGRTGVSVWRYSQQAHCYKTTLAEVQGQWKVTGWDVMHKEECRAAIAAGK